MGDIVFIKLNKYKQIVSSSLEKIESYIEIKTNLHLEELNNYFYNEISLKLEKREIKTPYPQDGLKYEYNGKSWILSSSLEEQESYYRNEIIKLNNKIINIENAGFGASGLRIKLEKLKIKHQEVTHLLGLEIDKTII